MGKWDKLSRRGVRGTGGGRGAFHVAFWGLFFFFSSAILAKVQKGLERKTGPSVDLRQRFHRTVGGTYV